MAINAAPRARSITSMRGNFGGIAGAGDTGSVMPLLLPRFATEQTVTVNTAAAGGNAELLMGMD